MARVISFLVAATLACGQPPASPFAWLNPAALPAVGSPVTYWGGHDEPAAVLDDSNCYPSSTQSCSSAPVVGLAPNGVRVVNFSSPGRFGVGNNLIIPGDYSSPNISYSLFFASSTAAGSTGQRILGAYLGNSVP